MYIAIKHEAAKIIVYIYNINKENWRFKVQRYYHVETDAKNITGPNISFHKKIHYFYPIFMKPPTNSKLGKTAGI